ncbi:MAG: metal dependent phosphohydrolase [uncultured bacterium]|nr:MAG: metal dependent phosphohydrolase [uncultured bacterium]HCU70304.1 hypothetical protein [Candidatus Moranbacteria bacterium]
MKQEFEKIWELALPFQDKRDDDGHAKIVTEYASKLCEIENADDRIAVPAAILHDIGWSKLSKEERFVIFDQNIAPELERKIRINHQQEGVRLAKKILQKAGYPPALVRLILEIVSQHDTRQNFFSKEDGAMRDGDKLWRFSKIGFSADLRRTKLAFDILYDRMLNKIDEKNFFFFESARIMAREEMENRKKEFEKHAFLS